MFANASGTCLHQYHLLRGPWSQEILSIGRKVLVYGQAFADISQVVGRVSGIVAAPGLGGPCSYSNHARKFQIPKRRRLEAGTRTPRVSTKWNVSKYCTWLLFTYWDVSPGTAQACRIKTQNPNSSCVHVSRFTPFPRLWVVDVMIQRTVDVLTDPEVNILQLSGSARSRELCNFRSTSTASMCLSTFSRSSMLNS